MDYEISELFEQLKADEEWEPDAALREEMADSLYMVLYSMM